ncbi:MAG: oxidoreductase [Acidimicrobiales bacterium]|nr:oxidoreductase [Acidimicrobiales bacterium]
MSMSAWESRLALPVSPTRDHIRGPKDAPVTLVEYGDYECPFCGMAHPVVEAVRARMGDELRFVFRHFPLATMHPHAQQAAEAAEAAGAQGLYWPMHDSLFENQRRLALADLVTRAIALGADVDRFEVELVRHVHLPKVQEDFLSGVHSGVNGTPTFFVNGLRYDGPVEVPALLAATRQVGQQVRARAPR